MSGALIGPSDIQPQLPENREVRIGCIGSGFIMADCQIPSYLAQGLNPVGIASRTFSHAQEVATRHGLQAYADVEALLDDSSIPVIDIAVPPDHQLEIIRTAAKRSHIRGILAQKPLGMNLEEAREAVQICDEAGIVLVVNQNMRYDQSVRACKKLLSKEELGTPVFATIDMRAVPHWMPWQEQLGWLTLRIMSIHHLDTFRYWFGTPDRVYASVRTDPRTAQKFDHQDGICTYILEYDSGMRAAGWDDVWAGPFTEGPGADIGIRWRVEGTQGLAKGTIGWPEYPKRAPSKIEYTSINTQGEWQRPTWDEVWFPDAFAGPMCELLCALETGNIAALNGHDNLETMALVEACYVSAEEHRAISPAEL